MNPRNKIPERDAIQRRKTFEEVCLGFDEETAKNEASRCLQCKNPGCVGKCPVFVKIPQFINALKQDDIESAANIIREDNLLPAICGRVCPQEKQCESGCILGIKGESVAIGALERFVGDYIINKASLLEQNKAKNTLNNVAKNVAVVGSGPASLACAADLIKAGINVVIYEAFHKPGGVLTYGIPEFRLPNSVVENEINGLIKLGVKIEKNIIVGKTISINELLNKNSAVFLGTGAGLPMFQNIPGENKPGVLSANEFLTRVNLMNAGKKGAHTPITVGKTTVVVGAGNVAMDSARTALRLGAEKVIVVYRRTKDEMPARREEILHAEQEGIEFLLLTNPVEIIGDKKVEGMVVQKMELGDLDSSGRRSPIPIISSEYKIECDGVIMALGTRPNPLIPRVTKDLKTTAKGIFVVTEDGETTIPNVFAGGDATTGAATVILAMNAGRKAAKAIIQRIKNSI